MVPKNIGMNASQTIQVEYMVNPMYLASLKLEGIFLVLTAYTVHRRIRIMLYTRDRIKEKVVTPQVSTALKYIHIHMI